MIVTNLVTLKAAAKYELLVHKLAHAFFTIIENAVGLVMLKKYFILQLKQTESSGLYYKHIII